MENWSEKIVKGRGKKKSQYENRNWERMRRRKGNIKVKRKIGK